MENEHDKLLKDSGNDLESDCFEVYVDDITINLTYDKTYYWDGKNWKVISDG